MRRGKVGLNLMRHRSLGVAVLQRREPHAVQRHVGIGRVGVKALADHQHRLAMRIAARLRKLNIRGQCYIFRNLLPHELKGVAGEPDVFSAAGERVSAVCGVVLRASGMKHSANVGMILKDAQRRCALPSQSSGGREK